MESIIDDRISKKYNSFINEDTIKSSYRLKEREKAINTIRKNKIKNELFPKKKNNIEIRINDSENDNDISIKNLNIEENLKNEKYINELISLNKYDIIFGYINEIFNNQNNFNIDFVKYGLYCLNEILLNLENNNKNSKHLLHLNDFINKYNFKDIIYLLLTYSKNENNKIDYEPVILKLIYQIIANYSYYCENNIDVIFLFEDKFLELHLYFFDIISDKDIIKNILLMMYNICIENNRITNKTFSFKNNKFFDLLIDYINNYQNDYERIEIILDLLICYINIFNYKETKTEKNKDDIVEMQDNTIKCDWDLIENIYNISSNLIYNKHNLIFSNSIILISSIIKLVYKSENIELMDILIKNNITKSMILFILEKDYEESPYDIIYMSEIIKYLIKFSSKSTIENNLKSNIKNILNDIEQNLNENDEIIDIFFDLLSMEKIKLKEKILIKLIETILSFVRNEYFYKNILENYKDEIFDIISKYINSSNYKIRKKIIKIVENMTNKRDFILADYFIKHNILDYIKKAIDPNTTYCHDEKLILTALKIINNLISIGEIFKKLNGFNPVLREFENIGGKELLDNLLCNKSEFVYNNALKIIERYYN